MYFPPVGGNNSSGVAVSPEEVRKFWLLEIDICNVKK